MKVAVDMPPSPFERFDSDLNLEHCLILNEWIYLKTFVYNAKETHNPNRIQAENPN